MDKRNGGQRDQHGAQVAEEEEQHPGHEERGHQQLHLQVAERGLDEVGLAEEDLRRAHAGRQAALHVGQRRLQAPGQIDGVGRRLLLDAEDDRRLAPHRRSRHRRA
jgi:hypothetical protein